MDWVQTVTTVAAAMGSSGAISAVLQARASKKAGVASNEIEANKTAVEATKSNTANWDVLSTHMTSELERLNKAVHQLNKDREDDDNYIEVLRDYIWAGNPPPPPARPPRIMVYPKDDNVK